MKPKLSQFLVYIETPIKSFKKECDNLKNLVVTQGVTTDFLKYFL